MKDTLPMKAAAPTAAAAADVSGVDPITVVAKLSWSKEKLESKSGHFGDALKFF